MTSISSKLMDMFRNRNLKSDAVPRAPRTPSRTDEELDYEVEAEDDGDTQNENEDTTNEPEEIRVESADEEDHKQQEKKPKFKKSFFKSNKKNNNPSFPNMSRNQKKTSASSVNTQATGNVINIVNASNIRFGNDYYMGPVNKPQQKDNDEDQEQPIQKNNLITLLLESKIKPEHEYIDYIAKNLGKNWRTLFRNLGYTKGRIETIEIETASYGVSEARYKLLLDWTHNDDDGTLGHLASLLWKEGEREIVKDLAIIYKKNMK